MDLDARILKDKTYIDCFNTKVAKEFIGKECYLSDDVPSFTNVDALRKATLVGVDDGDFHPYKLENTRWNYSSILILPCEWVKPKEKVYRPYTMSEFLKRFNLGDVVIVRRKGTESEIHKMFTEYAEKGERVCLGFYFYPFETLFDEYEVLTNGVWKPFGVKE